MKISLSIPVLVERSKGRDGARLFAVRPVLFAEPTERAADLSRALARLHHSLRQEIGQSLKTLRDDPLAAWHCPEEFDEYRIPLAFQLGSMQFRVPCLLLAFEIELAEGRVRRAFPARLPHVWFPWPRGADLGTCASNAVETHFRQVIRAEGKDGLDVPGQLGLSGGLSITRLELEFQRPNLPKANESRPRFSLGGTQARFSGDHELNRCGRNLNRLHPHGLKRALLRDAEAAELTQALAAPDRRGVLVVGPPSVGKTTVIHESLHRRIEERRRPHAAGPRGDVWLLAPQRLIAGMSFVGEWEDRVLAIFNEAAKRDHILYFDDLIGLFLAGRSSCSDLTIGHVVQQHMESGGFRVLGEIAPEALRRLREQQRAFADQFQIIHVREPSDLDLWEMLLHDVRELEASRGCRFDRSVLPTVVDLARRLEPERAFPGKAAEILHQIAAKHPRASIGRRAVLEEFASRTGVRIGLIDDEERWPREEFVERLRERLVGQQEALDAAADAVALCKARLNDPGRPLGTFLFLGPTGVGKTECAKALAHALLGSADRLLRFDMNEFAAPDAVERLAGSFRNPDGSLTGAIRRQPFAVLLFDEIEKADRSVFDLLLPVLGEARLTDAAGRTASFANAIVILTSNLGVRTGAGGGEVGFGAAPDGAAHDHRVAAERFFSPEFFNRIDRVVPFRPLSRAELDSVARALIGGLLRRPGLRERSVLLNISPGALNDILERGYDPRFGARAVRRAIESEVATPVARELARSAPGSIVLVELEPAASGTNRAIEVRAGALQEPERVPIAHRWQTLERADLLGAAHGFARRAAQAAEAARPEGAPPSTETGISAEQARYYALKESLREFELLLSQTRQSDSQRRRRARPGPSPEPLRSEIRCIARPILWPAAPDQAGLESAVRRWPDLTMAPGPIGTRLEDAAAERLRIAAEAALLAQQLAARTGAAPPHEGGQSCPPPLPTPGDRRQDGPSSTNSGPAPTGPQEAAPVGGRIRLRARPLCAATMTREVRAFARDALLQAWIDLANASWGWEAGFDADTDGPDAASAAARTSDASEPVDRSIWIEGAGIEALAQMETGIHILRSAEGEWLPLLLEIEGRAAPRHVLRLYGSTGPIYDVRTTLIGREHWTAAGLAQCFAAVLPWPEPFPNTCIPAETAPHPEELPRA